MKNKRCIRFCRENGYTGDDVSPIIMSPQNVPPMKTVRRAMMTMATTTDMPSAIQFLLE